MSPELGSEETSDDSRLVARAGQVMSRLDAACRRAGRDPSELTLVAVSKRHPAAKVREAHAAGLRVFGENHVQEGVSKAAALPAELEWHLIGPMQSNKVRPAVETFDVLHAVDRLKIAERVARECLRQDRDVPVFVQVNVGGEQTKHGFPVGRFEETVRPLARIDGLRIVGLMAIPPWEEDPERSRHWFRELRQLRDTASSWSDWHGFPGLLSMGMSHDFEVAIEEGATHLRVGTDIFGRRPS
ncbi:MAG: YggS family pyridoxal phosphate-dependent enzyme [Thermoanaerobaculia bacterium]|nr:YggS family pyridoxal phosphate-dependent enzyme [Thermoanaerobaculia bacterium]